jgi:uncharacterized protein YidB (DUF937 family)
MGLIDVLNGMQNGPHGQRAPSGSSGGMSPITMAILGVLAFKAIKSFTASQPSVHSASPGALPGGGVPNSGGLRGLGGLLAGGAAGSVLSSGLNDLLKQFQQTGYGDAANSWIGSGPNKAISPSDLASALGADKINALMTQSGMSRDELLQGLSQYLPEVVDQLTPEGRLPTEQEATHLL